MTPDRQKLIQDLEALINKWEKAIGKTESLFGRSYFGAFYTGHKEAYWKCVRDLKNVIKR